MVLNYVIIILVVLFIYIGYKFYDKESYIPIILPYQEKPNYGSFYNPLIQEKRQFNLGDKVFFYGDKYYIVGMYDNHKSWILLRLSKTMNDMMHKDHGLVVDSREVKQVVRID